ncbi:SRPBCC family protein [Streptomyces sp. NA02950]|uniref:SRPBCC family protein n=1 Tax=Streptomyces sp. NA02950 TaxID=2742137 RepID=UPI00158FAE97|nr:SRPBCC family protein [Streptomyces sp. NA02950]QKV91649.1 SRPBCC family protein [Streptomyces sp. NA02950]
MDWCRYRFRSRWELDAPPAAVYAALADGDTYPRWWPQIREVRRIDERTGAARFRSLVPYDLEVTVGEARQDPAAGVLEISLSGDLEGWVRWTVTARDTGTRALFEQEVVVRKPLLRRLALPGRPVFRLNHALMMRAGRRGLRAHLAATGAGRPGTPPASGGNPV